MMSEIAGGGKMIGMYVHQHWPYNHPYCARTWSLEDWRGYAGALRLMGYNSILVWPVLETIPDPPTPSDVANLAKMGRVIDMLHEELGMKVWLALCPNVAPIDDAASSVTFERRHFFETDMRVDPGDPAAMAAFMERRARVLGPLRNADGVSIIDSDPGGFPGSSNQEFVDLLVAHRRLLDTLRPGIELVYWAHAGWQGYRRFYETGILSFSTDEEHSDVLARLMAANPEPWGMANNLEVAEKLGAADRVISFNYGRIEGEPSFPFTNYGGDSAREGGSAPGPRGVMGNAQTHCVQLPNTFAFVRGALGLPVEHGDYVAFANEVLEGFGELIVEGWAVLQGSDPISLRAIAARFEAAADEELRPGRLSGLLFGSPRRFVGDLAMQLRMRAAFVELRDASGAPARELVRAFADATSVWQTQHGYENSWWWPELDPALRRIGSAEVDAILDGAFDPFKAPPADVSGTPMEQVAYQLRFTESFTPRLLAALKRAGE